MSSSLLEIPFEKMDGVETTLDEYRGKALLIVNVASKCGLTPQYEGLEKLWTEYRDKGLMILGFPANDFAGQEPGTHDEIQEFCSLTYGVDFPLFAKVVVTGDAKHPLYAALIEAHPIATTQEGSELRSKLESKGYVKPGQPNEVLWNFEKFLVNSAGKVVARFSPDTLPSDERLIAAIEQALPQCVAS